VDNSSTHSHPSEKENGFTANNTAAKIASVNRPLGAGID
jgi:hypothetical protein